MSSTARVALGEFVAHLPLIDNHVHGALKDDPIDAADFARHIAETDRPAPAGTTWFDTLLGVALVRWCAPKLDLDPDVDGEAYVARRIELGVDEVNRRLLRDNGIAHYLLETGYRGDEILGVEGMREASGARVDEVVRLETVAQELVLSGVDAASFGSAFAGLMRERTRDAVGTKSVAAYRFGLNLEPARPSAAEVAAAAGELLEQIDAGGSSRIDHPVLLRHLIWTALDIGLPLQFHTGMGDPDLHLLRADPANLTDLIKAAEPTGTQIVLLHCYPFHRNAAYLSRMFTNVSMDVGEAITYVGARVTQLVAEAMEVAPFHKIMFSSDAWGPAELHTLGARQWQRATSAVLGQMVDDDDLDLPRAQRIATMIASENARRIYQLEA